jgi:hypothetical protein
MSTVSSKVAAIASGLLDDAATRLRSQGQQAFAFRVDLRGPSIVLSLEVSRAGGDWQRNLVITLDAGEDAHDVEARITDDDQVTVARIGEARVADAQLADVVLAFTRAGIARLTAEVTPAPVG